MIFKKVFLACNVLAEWAGTTPNIRPDLLDENVAESSLSNEIYIFSEKGTIPSNTPKQVPFYPFEKQGKDLWNNMDISSPAVDKNIQKLSFLDREIHDLHKMLFYYTSLYRLLN